MFEWFAALNMIGVGFIVLAWPMTAKPAAFRYLVTPFFTESFIGLLFFAIGVSRIFALLINGMSWKYGPRVRAWCAAVSAIIWLELWFGSLRFAFFDLGTPTVGISNWLLFCFAEMIIAYRAATDVRLD